MVPGTYAGSNNMYPSTGTMYIPVTVLDNTGSNVESLGRFEIRADLFD